MSKLKVKQSTMFFFQGQGLEIITKQHMNIVTSHMKAIFKKCSERAWKCNFPPLSEIMTDRTDQPTDGQKDGSNSFNNPEAVLEP